MAAFKTVDTAGFDEAIQGFTRALDVYKKARELMKAQTKRLGDGWTGAGGDKFRSVTTKITRCLDDDEESLTNIIENLKEIRKTYIEWDKQVAQSMEGGSTP
jgi:uncharacterized protein YukE